jgi:hypothetical protein
MSNGETKDKIKSLIGLNKETHEISESEYSGNFEEIYKLWSSLETDDRKNKFATQFVEVAKYNPFVNHDPRVAVYKSIIDDLRKIDSMRRNGELMPLYLRPPSVVEKEHTDMMERRLNELGGIGSNASGGKSRRRRHHRRSSKKHKKARKSRRRVRL